MQNKPRRQLKRNFPRRLLINNIESFDEDFIASSFNDYFVHVGPNLSKTIPNEATCHTEYLSPFLKKLSGRGARIVLVVNEN